MRKDITVAAEPRSLRGKNEARRLRVQKLIPAIVYGTGTDPVAVSVNPKDLKKILNSTSGFNTIFNVNINGGENTPVMLADWQNDPVRGSMLHADLKRIDLEKRLRVKVIIHPVGEPIGVKQQGGLQEIINREVEIECLPDEIPEAFNVDVTGMEINTSLRASEIPMAGSMKLLSSPDMVILHVITLRAVVEETPAEGAVAATTAEPEVIKKGKKEEEEEAAAKKKK